METISAGTSNGISVEMRLIENARSLKASAKVSFPTDLGEITLTGFRVIEKEQGNPWVGMPQESFEREGQWVNIPLVEFAPRGKRLVAETILAEYKRQTDKNFPNGPQKV